MEDVPDCVNSQNSSVEFLEDVPQIPSNHERTREIEETLCGKTNEKKVNQRSGSTQDDGFTITTLTKQKFPPCTETYPITAEMDKSTSDLNLQVTTIERSRQDHRVMPPDSTCDAPAAEGGGTDGPSLGPHTRQQGPEAFSTATYRPDIITSMSGCYTCPSGTSVPSASLPTSEYLRSTVGTNTHSVHASSSETIHNPIGSSGGSSKRNEVEDSVARDGNTSVHHSTRNSNTTDHSATRTHYSNLTDHSATSTRKNNTTDHSATMSDNSTRCEQNVNDVMLMDGDVYTRKRLASGQSCRCEDIRAELSSRKTKDASSTSQTGGAGAAQDIRKTCRLALEEVMREVDAGLKGAALGATHDWSKCSHSVKVNIKPLLWKNNKSK